MPGTDTGLPTIELAGVAPAEEVAARAMFRAPGLRVPDIRDEELNEAEAGLLAGGGAVSSRH